MSNRKKMNKYEVFEQSFKTKTPGKSKKVVVSNSEEGSLILGLIFLPFIIVAKTIKFCIIGPSERDYVKSPYAKVYGVFSGMFMLFSSIAGLFFINDIGLFLKSYEVSKDYATFLNAFLIIFFIVQLVRGSGFMSGYNIGQTGAVNSGKWYNPHLRSSYYDSSTSGNINSRGEINEFMGYVNSKMSWMSNSDKENYVKDLFGGKK
jgi:hypothetical protein